MLISLFWWICCPKSTTGQAFFSSNKVLSFGNLCMTSDFDKQFVQVVKTEKNVMQSERLRDQ